VQVAQVSGWGIGVLSSVSIHIWGAAGTFLHSCFHPVLGVLAALEEDSDDDVVFLFSSPSGMSCAHVPSLCTELKQGTSATFIY
jgi:hypothetical protein